MLRPWQFRIQIRKESPTPVYVQIVRAIIADIRRGRLGPGSAMPGTRAMAKSAGVNRKTILAVYDELIAQGWLVTDSTRGTFVSPDLPTQTPRSLTPSSRKSETKREIADIDTQPSPLEIPMLSSTFGVLAFDDGTPDPRLVPTDLIARAFRRGLKRVSRRTEFGYGDPRGNFSLRQSISTMLNIERGLSTTPNNICLTRGSQMAIYICSQLLVKPGDVILVEELCYPPARVSFQQVGAKIISIPVDKNGLKPEEVEKVCKEHPVRAIYLTPHHHFPTTVSLSSARRIRLIALADKFNFVIVEDDYDHEFHFTHRPLLPLASADPDTVIYIGSLSKLLSPGLRIGYIAAPTKFIDSVAAQIMLIDRQGNPASELAVAEMIDEGEVRRHARKSRLEYARRRKSFRNCLLETFGDLLRFDVPDGGLAFWVRFKDHIDLAELESQSKEHNVQFLPSHSYSVTGKKNLGLRLGFASLQPSELEEATQRLYSSFISLH